MLQPIYSVVCEPLYNNIHLRVISLCSMWLVKYLVMVSFQYYTIYCVLKYIRFIKLNTDKKRFFSWNIKLKDALEQIVADVVIHIIFTYV